MKKHIRSFIIWVKDHKTQLKLAGVSVFAEIATIICIKNIDGLMRLKAELEDAITNGKRNSDNHQRINDDTRITEQLEQDDSVLCTDSIIKKITTRVPHSVDPHIRNLPDGWRASDRKIATATENGFDLGEGQTWVEKYSTGKKIA